MPLSLKEILTLPDIGRKITYRKKSPRIELPDRRKLWDDWNPERHEIMTDKEKYPDRKVLEKEVERVFDEKKLLDAVKAVFKSNKIKYPTKKIVRSWLSEQEVAEYFFVCDYK